MIKATGCEGTFDGQARGHAWRPSAEALFGVGVQAYDRQGHAGSLGEEKRRDQRLAAAPTSAATMTPILSVSDATLAAQAKKSSPANWRERK